jgi:hypothetical protein
MTSVRLALGGVRSALLGLAASSCAGDGGGRAAPEPTQSPKPELEEPVATTDGAPVAFPDNAVGRRGKELVELLNKADESAVEPFVSTRFAPTFRDAVPMDGHKDVMRNISSDFPALVLRQVVAVTDFEAELYLLSSTKQSWLRISLSVEPEPPHKLSSIFFRSADGPPDPAMADIDPGALTGEQRGKIVAKIDSIMRERYVDPKVAVAAGQFVVDAAKKGEYDDISKLGAFAERLTADLQKITKDKHVQVRGAGAAPGPGPSGPPPAGPHGLAAAKVLPGNIGYIDLRFFAPAPVAKETLAGAMKTIEDTDAIIFDMRKNGGGAPDGIRYLCSYLFDTKTHLNSLYWREGDRTVEFWTLDEIDGKKRPNVPVFVLTSPQTFSGAEEFTYNLQTRKRATIVGETTGGGANPGGMFDISPQLSIFVSTGKAINPVTKTNWEGVGVKPDVEVEAERALEKATALAKRAAKKYRKSK